jgi:hypothetical protein
MSIFKDNEGKEFVELQTQESNLSSFWEKMLFWNYYEMEENFVENVICICW